MTGGIRRKQHEETFNGSENGHSGGQEPCSGRGVRLQALCACRRKASHACRSNVVAAALSLLSWQLAAALLQTDRAALQGPHQRRPVSGEAGRRQESCRRSPAAISSRRPSRRSKSPTYSVVVNEVPVKELLFALSRDTRQNIDVHPVDPGPGLAERDR